VTTQTYMRKTARNILYCTLAVSTGLHLVFYLPVSVLAPFWAGSCVGAASFLLLGRWLQQDLGGRGGRLLLLSRWLVRTSLTYGTMVVWAALQPGAILPFAGGLFLVHLVIIATGLSLHFSPGEAEGEERPPPA